MPDFYESGGSRTSIAAMAQALSDLTPQDLMAVPVKQRPTWMQTRYPVSIERFEQLNAEARQPDAQPLETHLDSAGADVTADTPAAAFMLDLPEDRAELAPAPAAPLTTASFQGIPATGWRPSDTSIAVGQNNVMLGVNTDLAGYSKAGGLQFRWNNMIALFKNVLPSGASIFDPAIFYDHYADRYVVIVAARREAPAGSWLLIAASQTGNPGGAYWIWALDASLDGSNPTTNWADYPKVGFDTQAVYIATNQFQIGGSFQYAKFRILNKTELYSGAALRWYDFWNLKNLDASGAFTVQPADHFRGTGGNPPAYFVNGFFPSGSQLTLWTLTNPIGFWSGSSPTLSRQAVACRAYDFPPNAQQLGSTNLISTNDPRLLNAVFQNAGGVQRLWTCHTVKITWSGDAEARSGLQWYEIDVPSATIVQQNAYGASGKYYFFPAIQTDINRNMFLAFCRSGASEYVNVRQTGRRVTDTANSLQGSVLIKAGESSYPADRWGDYTGICRDGSDAATCWGYAQYAASGGNWGTWAFSMKF
jgi:hypothetical protein